MANTQRPVVPVVHSDEVEHRRQLAVRANASLTSDGTNGMTAPLRLSSFADGDDLPDATLWPASLAYVANETNPVVFSDGDDWRAVGDLVMQDNGIVTSGMFGASPGDLVTTQLQAMFDYCADNEPAIAIILPGTYNTDAVLTWDARTKLYGYGAYLQPDDATAVQDAMLLISGGNGGIDIGHTIEGLVLNMIYEGGGTFGLKSGILVNSASNVNLKNVYVYAGGGGLEGSTDWTGCITLQRSAADGDAAGVYFSRLENCHVEGFPSKPPIGIGLYGICNGTQIRECTVNQMGIGIYHSYPRTASVTDSDYNYLANGVVVSGCAFENQTGPCIKSEGRAGASSLSAWSVVNNRAENVVGHWDASLVNSINGPNYVSGCWDLSTGLAWVVTNPNSNTVMILVDGALPPSTVAQLFAASQGAGIRGFVTNATATTFHSTVAGGGANKVPVVSDGTNWLIG